MKPIKLAITLSLALASAAVPALAQAQSAGYGYGQQQYGNAYRGDRGQVNALNQQLFQLDRQIGRAQAMRQLSPREAYGLRGELNQLNREVAYASRGGLDRGEMRNLQQKIERLRFKVERNSRDGNRAYNGYGNDQRGDDQRRYDQRGH
ncbi:MAG: hypothetical protein WBL74_06315 [Novosphingobium sp.]|uniref:hypothetical protein n=1 Tax=Novosphingobium sp. TaxID=1874826 RepID=UPI003C7DD76A